LRQRLCTSVPSIMQLLVSTDRYPQAASCAGQATSRVVRMADGRGEVWPRKLFSSWIKEVTRPRGRCMSYRHDFARELLPVGFNLDKRAQGPPIGVSSDY